MLDVEFCLMSRKLILLLCFPITGICQQVGYPGKVIPQELTSYLPENMQSFPTGLRPAALSGLSKKTISIQAGNQYSISNAGSLQLALQGGNSRRGSALNAGFETSPVHSNIYASLGYGMKLNKSLAIGSSWSMEAQKIAGSAFSLTGEIQLGFLFKLNERVRWGAQYRQSLKQQSIATGFAYYFSEKLQLSAELDKESMRQTAFNLMISNQFHNNWLLLGGINGLSGAPFCFLGKTGIHQSWGTGLSFHPQLGSSFLLSFTRFLH
jgi:hypothetical protein